jgi:hypothetical protein
MSGSIKINTGAIFSQLDKHTQGLVAKYIGPNLVAKVNKQVEEIVDKFVLDVQEKIIKPKVPKKSGRLRQSIKVVYVHGTPRNIVIRMYAGYPSANTVPYAPYLEEGTKAHTIKASGVMHFVGFKKLRSPPKYARGRRKYSSKAVSDVFIAGKGGKGGVIRVKGIKPVHYMRMGAQYILRNLPNAIKLGLDALNFTDSDAQTQGTKIPVTWVGIQNDASGKRLFTLVNLPNHSTVVYNPNIHKL